jgi:hypothetical protein
MSQIYPTTNNSVIYVLPNSPSVKDQYIVDVSQPDNKIEKISRKDINTALNIGICFCFYVDFYIYICRGCYYIFNCCNIFSSCNISEFCNKIGPNICVCVEYFGKCVQFLLESLCCFLECIKQKN